MREILFEKDDDCHINLISAIANLRARNYSIEESPKHQVKLIAGNIIPALATTTTTTVGALGLELYKLFMVF